MRWLEWTISVSLLALGCEEDELPIPPPANYATSGLSVVEVPQAGAPEEQPGADGAVTTNVTTGVDGTSRDSLGDEGAITDDTNTLPTGTQELCFSTCDCPPAMTCLEGFCQPSVEVSWCCDDPLCPSGSTCEAREGGLALCP